MVQDNDDSEDDELPLKKKKPARKQPQKKGKVAVARRRGDVAGKLPPGPSSKEFTGTSDDNSE